MIKTKKTWILISTLLAFNILILWSDTNTLLNNQWYTLNYLLSGITETLSEPSSQNCMQRIKPFKKRFQVELTLLKKDGTILCSTEKLPQKPLSLLEFRTLQSGSKKGQSLRTDPQTDQERLYLATTVQDNLIRISAPFKKLPYRFHFIIFFNIFLIPFAAFWILSNRKMNVITSRNGEDRSNDRFFEEYAILFDSIELAVLIVESQSNDVLYYNQSLGEYFEISGKLNQSYKMLFFNSKLIQEISQNINNQTDNREIEIDGKTMLISSARLNDLCFVFFNDITLLKENESMKRIYVDAISHELKTPLTNILLYSEKLDDQLEGDDNVDNSKIYKNALVLKKMIDDILQLSKLDSPNLILKRDEIPLRPFFMTIINELELLIDRNNVDLEFDLPSSEKIIGDRGLLYKAFRNIVENSIKYNKFGGMVKIKVERRNEIFEIEISDTGMGIPKKSLNHIFERFYRVDQSRTKGDTIREGTGLGLSIVKLIIQLHKGTIFVDSEDGKGSQFTLRLPAKLNI